MPNFISLLPFILFMVGLIVIDVGIFLWSLIAGLIVAGISLILVALLIGQAIQQVTKGLKGDK